MAQMRQNRTFVHGPKVDFKVQGNGHLPSLRIPVREMCWNGATKSDRAMRYGGSLGIDDRHGYRNDHFGLADLSGWAHDHALGTRSGGGDGILVARVGGQCPHAHFGFNEGRLHFLLETEPERSALVGHATRKIGIE